MQSRVWPGGRPFRPFHDLTADPMTSQPIGQEERIDEEQAERGSPEQTSNHLLREVASETRTASARKSV